MKLTVRGLALCNGTADDVELFLHASRWIARREVNHETPSGQADNGCTVTSRQLMRAFRLRAAQRPTSNASGSFCSSRIEDGPLGPPAVSGSGRLVSAGMFARNPRRSAILQVSP